MAINDENPNAGYNQAIINSNKNSTVNLSSDGKITFHDLTSGETSTKASISIYDVSSSDFTKSASMATFNTNNALTIQDPKTDFFAQLDEAITAVENGRYRPDGENGVDPRNAGIQNGIQIIDDLNEHVNRMQTKAGAQSQTLESATSRTDMLLLNSKILRSEVLDTDIADATLKLQQLQLNYQAMYSSVSRISKLSLVNYM
jgi:flagellar hook-associated protein 3 FlgL